MDNFPIVDKEEPGTLSILLLEREETEDVIFVVERFRDEEEIQRHGQGRGIPVIMSVFQDVGF